MNRIVFICLGNICRSPAAEGLFRLRLASSALEEHVEVDSAGTVAWNAGNPPDHRSIAAVGRHGVDISDIRARKVVAGDFDDGNLLLAVDGRTRDELEDMRPSGAPALVELLMSYGHGPADLEDPYWGVDGDFEIMAQRLVPAIDGLVEALERHHLAAR